MAFSITKQKNGKFKVRAWGRADEFGKKTSRQQSNIETKAQAKTIALELEKSLECEEQPKSSYTFQQLYNLYMQAKAKNLSPNTFNRKKYYISATLDYWGKVKAININTKNVQEWVNILEQPTETGKKRKKSTVQEYVKVLNTILNWAVGQDYLEYNRIKKLEYLEDEEDFEPTILNEEKLKEILLTLKQEFYNLYIPVLISLLADPRRGEVLGITYSDIDFDNNIIYMSQTAYEDEKSQLQHKNTFKTKTSKRRILISNFLKNELLKHKELNKHLNSDFVCDNIFIGKITPSYITHQFHDFILNRFGIKMRFHDLRHNFNQLCFENDIDLSTRSKIMGHSSEKITNNTYTHFSNKKAKEAVESVTKALNL